MEVTVWLKDTQQSPGFLYSKWTKNKRKRKIIKQTNKNKNLARTSWTYLIILTKILIPQKQQQSATTIAIATTAIATVGKTQIGCETRYSYYYYITKAQTENQIRKKTGHHNKKEDNQTTRRKKKKDTPNIWLKGNKKKNKKPKNQTGHTTYKAMTNLYDSKKKEIFYFISIDFMNTKTKESFFNSKIIKSRDQRAKTKRQRPKGKDQLSQNHTQLYVSPLINYLKQQRKNPREREKKEKQQEKQKQKQKQF